MSLPASLHSGYWPDARGMSGRITLEWVAGCRGIGMLSVDCILALDFNGLWIVTRDHDAFLNHSENRLFFAAPSPNIRRIGSGGRLPALRNKLIFPVRVAMFLHGGVIVIVGVPASDGDGDFTVRWRVGIVSGNRSHDIWTSSLLRKADDCQEGRDH